MKRWNRLILTVLALGLLLSGCGAAQIQPEETAAPTMAIAPTEPAVTEPAPTEAPVDKVAALAEKTEFPSENAATGTLKFYIGDQAVFAGGLVSDLLGLGVRTYDDLSAPLRPGHISGNIRVWLEEGENTTNLFFTAINPTDESRAISDCLIYSMTVNMEEGIAFGSGNETAPFVTGISTYEELTAAYGEPDYYNSGNPEYEEIAYYEPFNYAYFSFKDGVVRQIMTVYSASIHGSLAESTTQELQGYFGNDAYLLMSRYLDMTDYLPGAQPREDKVAPALEEFILLDDMKIELGCLVNEMPATFSEPFEGIEQVMGKDAYYRTGIGNEEEFYLLNENPRGNLSSYTTVMGVIAQNPNYVNWGFDLSGFHTFSYQGMTNDSTIEDVLEIFGEPREMLFTSSAKACFVWMHYQDAMGNTLRLCVDPMTDQISEIRVVKYYEDAWHY